MKLPPFGFREYLDRIPTTDLYFLNPLAELKRQGARVPAPRCLSPNVYLVGRTGVIVRYGLAHDVGRLRNAGARRIVYIVDDDFLAAEADRGLPERYRAKLVAFAESDWPAIKEAADIVIVPGSVLAEDYGAKAVIVPPAWDNPPASLRAFQFAKDDRDRTSRHRLASRRPRPDRHAARQCAGRASAGTAHALFRRGHAARSQEPSPRAASKSAVVVAL